MVLGMERKQKKWTPGWKRQQLGMLTVPQLLPKQPQGMEASPGGKKTQAQQLQKQLGGQEGWAGCLMGVVGCHQMGWGMQQLSGKKRVDHQLLRSWG